MHAIPVNRVSAIHWDSLCPIFQSICILFDVVQHVLVAPRLICIKQEYNMHQEITLTSYELPPKNTPQSTNFMFSMSSRSNLGLSYISIFRYLPHIISIRTSQMYAFIHFLLKDKQMKNILLLKLCYFLFHALKHLRSHQCNTLT